MSYQDREDAMAEFIQGQGYDLRGEGDGYRLTYDQPGHQMSSYLQTLSEVEELVDYWSKRPDLDVTDVWLVASFGVRKF